MVTKPVCPQATSWTRWLPLLSGQTYQVAPCGCCSGASVPAARSWTHDVSGVRAAGSVGAGHASQRTGPSTART